MIEMIPTGGANRRLMKKNHYERLMADEETFKNRFASLKQATDEHPNDGLAWCALGDFLFRESENPNLAIRAYERARELLPDRDLRLRLGRAYVLKGETERGLAMMNASATERPRAEAFCILADTYLRNRQETEAEGAARSAVQLEPSFDEGHYLLGEALKNREPAAAIAAYRTAVSLSDNYALAWQALGRELINAGNVGEGVDALKKAVNLDAEDVWSRALLANALWRCGRPGEAEEQYLAAIAIAPKFTDLQRWYEDFKNSKGTEKQD